MKKRIFIHNSKTNKNNKNKEKEDKCNLNNIMEYKILTNNIIKTKNNFI